MEHVAIDERRIANDCREQSGGQFQEDLSWRGSDSISSGHDQVVSLFARHAGFSSSRFEDGQDGQTAYESLKKKSANVQGIMLAEGIPWRRRRAGDLVGKLLPKLYKPEDT